MRTLIHDRENGVEYGADRHGGSVVIWALRGAKMVTEPYILMHRPVCCIDVDDNQNIERILDRLIKSVRE